MTHGDILCVITGMEKAGTTYLSKLLASDPRIMCGFECGLLLGPVSGFNKVSPWFGWMQETTAAGHWGITPDNMKRICAADSYLEAYGRIKQHAGDLGPRGIRSCFRQALWIVDKTPRYLFALDRIMGKVDLPFIVIEKDVFRQYLSFKKRGLSMGSFITRYYRARRRLKAARTKYPHRVRVVDFGELLEDTAAVLGRIYGFLGISPYPDAGIDGFYRRTGLDAHGGLTRDPLPVDPRLHLTDHEIQTLGNIRDMPDRRLGLRALAALPGLAARRLRTAVAGQVGPPQAGPMTGGGPHGRC